MQASWQELGYDHGVQGYSYDQGKDIVFACREFGITPQLEEYKKSYQQGLAVFCVPEHGFTLGIQGQAYNGVCNDEHFRRAWEEGNDRYQIEARKAEIDQRIDTINWQLQSISNELSNKNNSSEKRKELRYRRTQLERERKDLRRERSLLPLLDKLPSFNFRYEL